MNRLTIYSLLASIFPTGYFIWTGQMQIALLTIIFASTIDVLTGIVKAMYCGKFRTSIIWDKGLKKVVRLFLAIMTAYMLEIGPGNSGLPLWSFLNGVFTYLCFFWAIIEALSILENLDDMGLTVPTGFIKHIRRMIQKEECNPIDCKKNEN